MKIKYKLDQNGSIFIAILIIMPFFLTVAASYMQLAVNGFRVSRSDLYKTSAQFAADAGVDYSLGQINIDPDWAGTTDATHPDGEVELHNDGDVRTTYEVTVTPIDDDHKSIISTGRTYKGTSTTNPLSTINIDTTVRAVSSGEFSIVTGVGGLYLSNQATVLGGDVFVNGELEMTGSSQIGLTTADATLQVAHKSCPIPSDPNFEAEYPRICGAGENGEPISISNPAWIYADVQANNQISTDRMSDEGLTGSSGVAEQALPEHLREAQKTAHATAVASDPTLLRTGSDASCTTNNGSETWRANTKITGDVEIDRNCTVTIEGDVWITGDFEMSHSQAKLQVSDLVDDVAPRVMVDGQNISLSNGSTIVSNDENTGVWLIDYWSDTSCSPDCTEAEMVGSNLYNSREDPTITFQGTSSGATSIFYARWTKVLVHNSGQVGALVGQTVDLRNSGTITFGSSAGGPAITFWVIDSYRRDL